MKTLKRLLGVASIGFGVIMLAGIWEMPILISGPVAIMAIIAIMGGIHTF